MPVFRRICCPVDFSEASRAGLEMAARLARRDAALLTVLHVTGMHWPGVQGEILPGRHVGEKGEAAIGSYDGYDVLLFEIIKMFRTGVVPVSPQETLELYAFMEAADESKRRNGAEVTLKEVMDKARAEAAK